MGRGHFYGNLIEPYTKKWWEALVVEGRPCSKTKSISRLSEAPSPVFLDVKIVCEFQRMRTHSERLNLLLAFVSDPTVDQLRRKNIALQQEFMIRFQCV